MKVHWIATVQLDRLEKSDLLLAYSGTTLRPVLLLWDDISTYPAAPGWHFDLFCCSRTSFRLILLLRDVISTNPVALGLTFGLFCCFGTTFRLYCCSGLRDDISNYPAAPGWHFDVSCRSTTTFGLILLLRDEHTSRRLFWSQLCTFGIVDFTCMQVLHTARLTKLCHSLVAGPH